ncbi:hypothetical protein ACFX11_025855 [Malus domestica]
MPNLKPSWTGEDEQDRGEIDGWRSARCPELHRCISTTVAARLLDDVEFLSRRSNDSVSKYGASFEVSRFW